ncbi:hypothetical protein [Cellulosimicrobium sp. Marseille-Q8652]
MAGIIQTYGLLEQSLDALLIAVAQGYNVIHTSFDEIPERVRVEFRRLSLQSILDGSRSRLREQIDESVVLSAINSSSLPEDRRLIPAVFTKSQANYRHPHVRELLARLDVSVEVPPSSTMQSVLDELGMANAESVISDLVERRNALAHAYSFPDDILAVEQITAIIDVVEFYLLSLEEAASRRMLDECVKHARAVQLGTVAKRWAHAIGVDVDAGVLSVGESLLFRRKNGRYLCREIASLVLDGENIASVDASSCPGPLAVGVGFANGVPPRLNGAAVFRLPTDYVDFYPVTDS